MTQKLPNYYVIIPAAGIGSRMQCAVPKQYLKIGEQAILEKTLAVFLEYAKISQIIVALHKDDQHWSALLISQSPKIQAVKGGDARSDSVWQSLLALENQAGPNDWVLVHDACRPFITHADLDRLINALDAHEIGGLLGLPVRDTLKRVNKANVIETVARDNLWHAQTPQMFRYHVLKKAMQQVIDKNLDVTDDASAVELLGLKPLVVQGKSRNIKITYPEDLELSRA